MEGFYYWLAIFIVLFLYSVLLIHITQKYIVPVKGADAILSFNEDQKQIKANFVLLLPIDEVRSKDYIFVEIQNNVVEEDNSQEKQDV